MTIFSRIEIIVTISPGGEIIFNDLIKSRDYYDDFFKDRDYCDDLSKWRDYF